MQKEKKQKGTKKAEANKKNKEINLENNLNIILMILSIYFILF